MAATGHDGDVTNGISFEKKPRVQTDLEKFDDVFPEIVDLLVGPGLKDKEIVEACKWFKEVLEYNVPHGKKFRGVFVGMAYKLLVKHPSEEDLHLCRILGWCIELLQAFFLIADDIMDNGTIRRGKPCWFRKEGVGMEAVNDSIFLESCLYKLLRHFIRKKPYYVHILELFHEISHYTVSGQCLDMIVAPPPGTVNFQGYTIDKYKAIVKWKTGFYSFYLPAALAMYMAGIEEAETHDHAKSILLKIGEYYQVQDDFLDTYGDPVVVGKIGTDIPDNKCSWLVITALEKATDEQVQILKDNYGSTDEEKISRVKALYKELDLESEFRQYEEKSFQEIMTLINEYNGCLPKDMFIAFVQKLYKRIK